MRTKKDWALLGLAVVLLSVAALGIAELIQQLDSGRHANWTWFGANYEVGVDKPEPVQVVKLVGDPCNDAARAGELVEEDGYKIIKHTFVVDSVRLINELFGVYGVYGSRVWISGLLFEHSYDTRGELAKLRCGEEVTFYLETKNWRLWLTGGDQCIVEGGERWRFEQ